MDFLQKLHDILLQICWLVVKNMKHVRTLVKAWNLLLIFCYSQKNRFSLFLFFIKIGRVSLKIRKFFDFGASSEKRNNSAKTKISWKRESLCTTLPVATESISSTSIQRGKKPFPQTSQWHMGISMRGKNSNIEWSFSFVRRNFARNKKNEDGEYSLWLTPNTQN